MQLSGFLQLRTQVDHIQIFAFGDQFLFKLRWHRVNQCCQIHFGILSRGYATAVADSIAQTN